MARIAALLCLVAGAKSACEYAEQYAVAEGASADSSYGGAYTPGDAAGPPSVGWCGTNQGGSWAPAYQSAAPHVLSVAFEFPARASEVRVYEHANPKELTGFVKKIDALDAGGAPRPFWQGDDATTCGGFLAAAYEGGNETEFAVHGVVVYTQTAGAAWEYVDAVQLIGRVCDEDAALDVEDEDEGDDDGFRGDFADAFGADDGGDASVIGSTTTTTTTGSSSTTTTTTTVVPRRYYGGDDGRGDDDDGDDDGAHQLGAPKWLFVLLFYVLAGVLVVGGGLLLFFHCEERSKRSEADAELQEIGVPPRDRKRYVASLRTQGLETRAALLEMRPLPVELVEEHGFREGHARAFAALLNANAPVVLADVALVPAEEPAEELGATPATPPASPPASPRVTAQPATPVLARPRPSPFPRSRPRSTTPPRRPLTPPRSPPTPGRVVDPPAPSTELLRVDVDGLSERSSEPNSPASPRGDLEDGHADEDPRLSA